MMELFFSDYAETLLVIALLVLFGFALFMALSLDPRVRNNARPDRRKVRRPGSDRRTSRAY